MSKKRNIHITPHPRGGWQTIREGAGRTSGRYATQREAIGQGRGLAKRDKVKLLIHRRDGSIRGADSHGNDPHVSQDDK